MIKNGRWRGSMPFRRDQNTRPETLRRQGRTGEPSPATIRQKFSFWGERLPEGYGRAKGSFTENFRRALFEWMKGTCGNPYGPITFQYRLYRRKIITVTGISPQIFHYKKLGRGSKGFFIRLKILAIDGAPPAGFAKIQNFFALNKIVGQHPIRQLLALTAPQEHEAPMV